MSRAWFWWVPLVVGCAAPVTRAGEPPTFTAASATPSDSSRQGDAPDDIVRYLRAAERALRVLQLDRAEQVAKAGIEIGLRAPTPDHASSVTSLYRILGIVHAKREQYTQAEEALGNAIAWSERSSDRSLLQQGSLTLLMGRAQLLGCRLDRARASLERVVQIEGPLAPQTDLDVGLAWTNLAEVDEESDQAVLARDKLERAETIFRRVEANEPAALGDGLRKLASIQEQTGQRDEAARTLARLVDLMGRFPAKVTQLDVPKFRELVGTGADAYLSSHGIVLWRRATAAAPTASPEKGPQARRCAKSAPAEPARMGQVSNAERVVSDLRSSFRSCYQAELMSRSNAGGHVRLTSKIGADGSVVEVVAVGAGFSTSMVECVGTHVLSARFSPPEGGGATIVIPVTLVLEGTALKDSRLPF
jgi:tetratricopeptide (TPR) repeat protein